MSTTQPPKANALRIIWAANSNAGQIVSHLGPFKTNESRKLVLRSGNMTTDEIARQIREYAKLRDEILHTMRLIGVNRTARNSVETSTETGGKLKQDWSQLEELRNEYREIQSRQDSLEKLADEVKKRFNLINQVLETGFDLADVKGQGQGFTKILGRAPTRRLLDIEKSLLSALGDNVVIAIGNQKGDWTYLIVALSSDKSSLALQTLVLHDFSQTEIPNIEQPDLKTARDAANVRMQSISDDLKLAKEKLGHITTEAAERLNRLLDTSEESLVYLRAVLRIGEGVNAEHAFAIPEKTPSPKILDSLVRSGALVESG